MMKKLAKIKIFDVDGVHARADVEYSDKGLTDKQSLMTIGTTAEALHNMIAQTSELAQLDAEDLTGYAVAIVRDGYTQKLKA